MEGFPLGESATPPGAHIELLESPPAFLTIPAVTCDGACDTLHFPMITETTLGICPFYETQIPAGMVLTKYEDGVYAECLSCEEPVHPS